MEKHGVLLVPVRRNLLCTCDLGKGIEFLTFFVQAMHCVARTACLVLNMFYFFSQELEKLKKRREDSEETSQELRLAREQLQNTVSVRLILCLFVCLCVCV